MLLEEGDCEPALGRGRETGNSNQGEKVSFLSHQHKAGARAPSRDTVHPTPGRRARGSRCGAQSQQRALPATEQQAWGAAGSWEPQKSRRDSSSWASGKRTGMKTHWRNNSGRRPTGKGEHSEKSQAGTGCSMAAEEHSLNRPHSPGLVQPKPSSGAKL